MPPVLKSPVFWSRVVGVLVVVSLGLALAKLTWRLTGWDDGRTRIETPAALPNASGATASSTDAIIALAPFGGGAATGGLPESSLGLVLKGIVLASGSGSSALISVGGGPGQTFVVGQAPIGNAVIEAIEDERVVLNVGGRREALSFPRLSGGAAPAAPAPMPAPVAAQPSPEAAAALAAASPVATAAARAAASAPPPVQPAPPPSPAASLGAMGVTAGSQGYVIGADSAPQLLRAGLRPGDVVKSLNGTPLGNPSTDQQVLQQAAAGGRARVEIVRDGRTVTLTVPLR